ncbi:hypothetical protein [Nostoc sp.]
MQSFNITLPDAIANTLNTYIKDQEVSIAANVDLMLVQVWR